MQPAVTQSSALWGDDNHVVAMSNLPVIQSPVRLQFAAKLVTDMPRQNTRVKVKSASTSKMTEGKGDTLTS